MKVELERAKWSETKLLAYCLPGALNTLHSCAYVILVTLDFCSQTILLWIKVPSFRLLFLS